MKTSITLAFLTLLFIGCRGVSNKEWEVEEIRDSSILEDVSFKEDSSLIINKSMTIKDTNVIVSFKGFVIGEPITPYIGKAIPPSSRVDKLDAYSKYVYKTSLKVNSVVLPTEVNIFCINDTISLIVAYVIPHYENQYKTYYDLKEMFVTKYGEECSQCSLSDYSKQFIKLNLTSDDDMDYKYHYGWKHIWNFPTTSISLLQVDYDWLREDYVIDSYGKRVYNGLVKETTEGEKYILVYCQKDYFPILLQETKKWNEYSKRQQYRQDSIEQEKQRVKDSLELAKKRKRVMHDANQI